MRQNLHYFLERPYEYYLILSGDQLYRMDYGALLQAHIQKDADITPGTTPVDRQAASGFGILHSDAKRHIFRFEEKPKDPELLDELRIPPDLLTELGRAADVELYQGSMGIYVFNRQVLIDALASRQPGDFGKHIIPASLQKHKVFAYIFQEYWEDIGTVRAFFEANLALSDPVPTFNFFDHINPIYTQQRFLPASKVSGTQVQRAIIADGCVISDANIDRAVIGIRSVIGSGTTIRNSVLMGHMNVRSMKNTGSSGLEMLMGQTIARQKPGSRIRAFHHLASDAAATLRVPLSTKTLVLAKES